VGTPGGGELSPAKNGKNPAPASDVDLFRRHEPRFLNARAATTRTITSTAKAITNSIGLFPSETAGYCIERPPNVLRPTSRFVDHLEEDPGAIEVKGQLELWPGGEAPAKPLSFVDSSGSPGISNPECFAMAAPSSAAHRRPHQEIKPGECRNNSEKPKDRDELKQRKRQQHEDSHDEQSTATTLDQFSLTTTAFHLSQTSFYHREIQAFDEPSPGTLESSLI
jgi:hypothetical protein